MWFGENMASTTQKGYNSFRFDSALGGVHTDAAQSVQSIDKVSEERGLNQK